VEGRGLRSVAVPWALLLAVAPAPAASAVDWAAVPSAELLLFHTGTASYEGMLTEKDHSGGPKIRQGKACLDCHAGEEKKIGELIASGKKLEPTPAAVQAPWSAVAVQLAVDGDRLALRLQWPAKGPGASRSAIAFMFDDGSVNAATLTGCWATCHSDLPAMGDDAGRKLTKYLTQSRTKVTRTGGGELYQPESKLAELAGHGTFLEYWQAALKAGAPAAAEDGYVLDKRHESDAPLVRAEGGLSNGVWTVVLSRPLVVSKPHRKDLVEGKTYTFGLAVHDEGAEGRFHRVSFERQFELEGGRVRLLERKPQ
jgi:cytochrome c-type protein NapC